MEIENKENSKRQETRDGKGIVNLVTGKTESMAAGCQGKTEMTE